MTKRSCKWSSLSVALLVALLMTLLTSCLSWWQPENTYEIQISSNKGYYIIKPDTILESLSNNQIDVFVSTTATPEPIFSMDEQSVDWNQSDYFQIAAALHQFVWEEPLESWKLHRMSFVTDCPDADKGFEHVGFEFYTLKLLDEKESRLVRDINIYPRGHSIDWLERELYPIRESWKEIDLAALKISAENALQIAEGNGGLNTRSTVSNECTVHLTLAPDGFYKGWQVGYSNGGPKYIFRIHIDPFTGEYEVVNP